MKMGDVYKQDISVTSKADSTGKLSLVGNTERKSLTSVTHPCTKLPVFKFNPHLRNFGNRDDALLASIPFRINPNVEFSDDEDDYARNESEDEQDASESENGNKQDASESVSGNEQDALESEKENEQKLFDSHSTLSDDDDNDEVQKPVVVEVSCSTESGQPNLATTSGNRFRKTPYRPRTTQSSVEGRALVQKVDENTINAFDWRPPSSTNTFELHKPFPVQNRIPLQQIIETLPSTISSELKLADNVEKPLADPLWKLKKSMNQHISGISRENRAYKANTSCCIQKKNEVICKNIPKHFVDRTKLPGVSLFRPFMNVPHVKGKESAHAGPIAVVRQSSDHCFAPPKYIPRDNTPLSIQACLSSKQTACGALTEKQRLLSNEVVTVNNKSYTVLALVGRGGSCKVHSVYDQEAKAVVALKCVNLDIEDSSMIDGYKKEIEYLKVLQGSNRVIKMYDYEYLGNELRIILEKGDSDLANVIANEIKIKPLSPHTIKFYWSHMLEAVAEIHKFGIVHSDLKPANFLFVVGQLKLIDFGIASSVPTDMTSTFRETAAGTLNYMSPEALTSGAPSAYSSDINKQKQVCKVSTKSDVWSLGCILYNLVYGHSPFHSFSSKPQRMLAILNPDYAIPFPPIDDLSLMDVLQSCLKRNPKERATVEELLNHPYLAPEVKKNESNGNHESGKDLKDVLAQIEALTPRRMTVVSKILQDLHHKQNSQK